MIAREQIYQAATLVLIVGFLDALERRHPRVTVNRGHNLGLNITAILVVIFAGELWKIVLIKGFDALKLSSVLGSETIRSLPSVLKILLGGSWQTAASTGSIWVCTDIESYGLRMPSITLSTNSGGFQGQEQA